MEAFLDGLELKKKELLGKVDRAGVLRGPTWSDIEFADECGVALVVLGEGVQKGEGNAPDYYYLVRKEYVGIVPLIFYKEESETVKKLRKISDKKSRALGWTVKTSMAPPDEPCCIHVTRWKGRTPLGTYHPRQPPPEYIRLRTTEIHVDTPSVMHLYDLAKFLDGNWPRLTKITIPYSDDCLSTREGNLCTLRRGDWTPRGSPLDIPTTPLPVYFPWQGRLCLRVGEATPGYHSGFTKALASVTPIASWISPTNKNNDFFGEALRHLPNPQRPTLIISGVEYYKESERELLVAAHSDILSSYKSAQLRPTWEFSPPYEKIYERVVICNLIGGHEEKETVKALALAMSKEGVVYHIVHRRA